MQTQHAMWLPNIQKIYKIYKISLRAGRICCLGRDWSFYLAADTTMRHITPAVVAPVTGLADGKHCAVGNRSCSTAAVSKATHI